MATAGSAWAPCLLLLALLVVYGAQPTFYHISDIHYDPLAFPQKYNSSTLCRPSLTSLSAQYAREYDSDDTSGIFGRYGCDTSSHLLNSTFDAMRRFDSKPDFIIFTGDAPAHGLDSTSQIEAIQYVANMAYDSFPGTPFIPVIGNDDVFPDYIVACKDPHLGVLYSAYVRFIPSQQSLSFLNMGAFATSPRAGVTVLSLNTILYSQKNSPGLGADPCGQFEWLQGQLDNARDNNQKVYLAGHIPPGLDPDYLTPLWYPDYTATFLAIVLKNSDIICATLFGHIHRDEFRVISGDMQAGVPTTSLLTASSISPIYDNNPTFRHYTYDQYSKMPIDYSDYFIDLYQANQYGVASWAVEYNFSTAYKQESISSQTLAALYNRLKNDPLLFAQWYDRRVGQFVDNKQATLCVLTSPDMITFDTCMGIERKNVQ